MNSSVRCAVVFLIAVPLHAATAQWRTLQPGVEYAQISTLHVVRIDPARAKVRAAMSSQENIPPQTTAAWCRRKNLAVAINLGMFQTDGRSNVGYLRQGKHVNNPRWNGYQSILAIGPGARWFEQKPPDEAKYDLVVQNLRLIAPPGKNVWSPTPRRWSEAAIAMDSHGRLLFLFSRVPYAMPDFNRLILGLPLDITRAMHVEGGPEASLSIHAGNVNVDLAGSFETGFLEDDSNTRQWAIPNVLGVVRE